MDWKGNVGHCESSGGTMSELADVYAPYASLPAIAGSHDCDSGAALAVCRVRI
jgi:hypothetical protein